MRGILQRQRAAALIFTQYNYRISTALELFFFNTGKSIENIKIYSIFLLLYVCRNIILIKGKKKKKKTDG